MASGKQQDDVLHRQDAPSKRQHQEEERVSRNPTMVNGKEQQPRYPLCGPNQQQQQHLQPKSRREQRVLRNPTTAMGTGKQLEPRYQQCVLQHQPQQQVDRVSRNPDLYHHEFTETSSDPAITANSISPSSKQRPASRRIAEYLQLETERPLPLHEQIRLFRLHDKEFSLEEEDERPQRPTGLFGSGVIVQPHEGKGVAVRMPLSDYPPIVEPEFHGKSTENVKIAEDSKKCMSCNARNEKTATSALAPPSKPAAKAPVPFAKTKAPQAPRAHHPLKEEDWDKLPPYPPFNPFANIQDRPFIWVPPGLPKSERRAFREQERRRRNILENLEFPDADEKTPFDKKK